MTKLGKSSVKGVGALVTKFVILMGAMLQGSFLFEGYMKTLSILLLLISCVPAITLDSLIRRSDSGRRTAVLRPGIILKRMDLIPVDNTVKLTPPDELFNTSRAPLAPSDSQPTISYSPAHNLALVSPVTVSNSAVLEYRVMKLEESVDKVSTILENIQSQAESNTKNLDDVTKQMQIIASIIAGIGAIIGGLVALVKLLKGKTEPKT